MKKILALALVLAMMLTMFSFVTSAADATPEGTAISTEADFDTLVAGGKYYLANDIKMSGTATHLIPNGVTIDGCGYTISIDGNKEMTAPLFELESLTAIVDVLDPETNEPVMEEKPVLDDEGNPVLDGEGNPVTELVKKTEEVAVDYETATTFKNVFLGSKGKLITFSKTDVYNDSYSMTAPVFENNNEGVKVVFDNVDMLFYRPQVADDAIGYVNTLFWYIHGEATFVDCDLTASIASTPGQLGGFALNSDAVLTFDNCTVAGSIASTHKAAGFVKEITALAAEDEITFVNCTNNATITSGNISAGFISDLKRGTFTMKDCVNNGNLTTGSNSGAFVGAVGSSSKMPIITFDGLVNNGSITAAKHHVGGIIGNLSAGATTEVVVKNCENNGSIYQEEAGGYVGGIIGNMGRYTTTIENCINNGKIVAKTQFIGGIVGRVAKDAGIADWRYGLLTIKNCHNTGAIDASAASATGDLGGIISTAQGNNNLTQCSIRLLVIDCTNTGTIGAESPAHRIAAGIMAITDQNPTHTEYINNFVNCVNYGTLKGGSLGAGGILGYAQDSSYFENCVNAGEITAKGLAAGGIMGFSSWRAGTTSNAACQIPDTDPAEYWCTAASRGIKAVNCINLGNVTGLAALPVGGMFGQVNATVRVEIDNCANYGIISGGNDAGGAFANHQGGDLIVNNFTNYGDVSGNQIVGGIVGWKVAGDASVTNCVNYGNVKGCHGVGGIMGEIVTGTIANCLNAGDVAPFSANAEGIGGILGIFRNVANVITIENVANIGTVTGTVKANTSYGCFTEGVGQFIGRVGGSTNGNDPYIADSDLAANKFDDGDATAPAIKLINALGYGVAQINPDAQWAPSEYPLSYVEGKATWTPAEGGDTNDVKPELRNNGAFGDNVKVAEDSTYDLNADITKLEAMGFAANFKVVDGKIVVDNAATLRGYQIAEDNKAIRFAATLDSADVDAAGFIYSVSYNGTVLAKDVAVEATNLMYAVKAGNGLSTELAAVNGGKLFNTITFKGIPAAGTLEITVQATVDGVATGAQATITFVDGVIAK